MCGSYACHFGLFCILQEIAVSLDTTRKSTVITKEPCELMSIGKRDYQRIFMHGGKKSIGDPDQEEFLKYQNNFLFFRKRLLCCFDIKNSLKKR